MAVFLQVEDLTKSYGDRILFDSISFGVNEGDKIGIIAKNGTGKSTFLKIIADKENVDDGKITFKNDLRVGYLEQIPEFNPYSTVLEACLNENGKIAQIISKYEQALINGDSEDINDLILQMDSACAWDF